MAQSTTSTVNPSGPYPENTATDIPITLSGLTGPISALTLRFDNFTTDQMLGLAFLLVAPDGTSNIAFMSESGLGFGVTNQTLYFTDSDAESSLSFPILKPFDRGSDLTIRDTNYHPGFTVHSAPYSGTATFASSFNGIDPNGTWHVIVVNDGFFTNNVSIGTINLQVVTNVAPVLSVPDHLSVDAGSTLTFSAANGNLPTGSDADADVSDFGFVDVTVEHGTLGNNAPGFPVFHFSPTNHTGLGTGVNAAVSFLFNQTVYTPDPGFTGVDHITVKFSDEGELGLRATIGGLSVTKTIDIEVFQHLAGTAGDDSFTASGYQKIDGGAGKDTIAFDFALVDATVTYKDNTVTIEGPDTKTVLTGFEKFVFTDGTVDNADGNPLVDDLFYFSRNHDVWAANADADQHFAQFGWHEGRDPNAFFDTAGYLAHYADVKAAGLNPLQHYDQIGWLEGRDPSTAFDTTDYLAANPDVAAAKVDPLAHFLLYGPQEGRHAFNDGAWG